MNALKIVVAGLFVLVLTLIFMKVSEVPEITFANHPDMGEIIWEAKHPDGTEMSIKQAQEHVDSGGRYVRQTHTLAPLGHDRFGMELDPFTNLSWTEKFLQGE
jgi:hypothetical protein